MAEIGGQGSYLGVDVNSLGVPGLDASHDHPVPQVARNG
jgi:hypothetical protein